MITILSGTLHLLARSSRALQASRALARYSTKKDQEGGDKQQPKQPKHPEPQKELSETSTQQAKQQKPVDKGQLLDKYNTLTAKVEGVKKSLEEYKDFEEKKAAYKKLNQQLVSGREKITSLIEEGKKQWDRTREKVAAIEDQQISSLGKQFIKFHEVLKQLAKSKLTKDQQQSLVEGIDITSRILLHALQKFSFKPYEPLREKYDPKKHTKVDEQGQKEGVVTEVVEPGWMYKNRVLKNAKVHVGK